MTAHTTGFPEDAAHSEQEVIQAAAAIADDVATVVCAWMVIV